MTTVGLPPSPRRARRSAPRELDPGHQLSDRVFHGSARTIGLVVLGLTGAIGIFLGYQSIPTLRDYGWRFFTQTPGSPS